VLSNLLTNALKYTPHGGTVEITVAAKVPEPGPDILQIAVTDTGVRRWGRDQAHRGRTSCKSP
jgi:signal transduction histidine kinase